MVLEMEPTTDSDEHNVNPSLTDYEYLPSDLEKMKGDAIGNTLYSERWVLKMLIKITKFSEQDWNDEFESDLCSLWDMTLEKDVVDLLMKHDILTIITTVISEQTNSRLTEIMVGIIGNMCCVQSVRQALAQKEDTTNIIFALFDRLDTHILIQLVRLLHAVVWDLVQDCDINSPRWLENAMNKSQLTPYFSFILKSSTNEELLCCVLEFLNTTCTLEINDKDFSQSFATSELVSAMLDTWQQLFSTWAYDEGFPSKQLEKAAAHWCGVLSSFCGNENGRTAVCEFADLIGNILFRIVHRPVEYLDAILISAVNLLNGLLPTYFNGNVLKQLLVILHQLYQNSGDSTNDASNGENLDVILQDSIETYCANISISITRNTLNSLLAECGENHVLLFWKSVSDRQLDDPGERVI